MEEKTCTWENYGDAEPLEHGGIFVLSDEEKNGDAFKGRYYIEKVNTCPDTGKFIVDSLYVDINDSWIEKDKIIDFADLLDDNPIEFAIACTDYYDPLNFGTVKTMDTEQEVKDYFKDMGIEL